MPEQGRTVRLASESDAAGFRLAARRLLAAGERPEDVAWQVEDAAAGELFDSAAAVPLPNDDGSGVDDVAALDGDAATGSNGSGSGSGSGSGTITTTANRGTDNADDSADADAGEVAPRASVPPWFITLCAAVVLHSDPARFALLYRLLWRLVHEPGLRHDPLDADRARAEDMARVVRRDMHKMKAFVRFRPIDDGGAEPLHVAWFEPMHHIVEAVGPFFSRRFAQMRWAILTPLRSIRWDGHTLVAGPGAKREDAPAADAGEQLWLTYYEHIFNPARLKVAMMMKEMPRRYWHNLPEAKLIQPLTAQAMQRTGQMVEQPTTVAARRRPDASIALRIEPAERSNEAPATLQALAVAERHCRDCPIGELATQAVAGEGPLEARLMLVGEQPGDQEDLQGRPFVGPAGQLLDRALAELGWPRDALYLTNAVKHFKFDLRGKRRIHKTAAQREVSICLQWLEREIELVKPKAIVALGATASRALMGRAVAVTKERGQWLQREDGQRVLITLHPSALLRMEPAERDEAYRRWLEDLRLASE